MHRKAPTGRLAGIVRWRIVALRVVALGLLRVRLTARSRLRGLYRCGRGAVDRCRLTRLRRTASRSGLRGLRGRRTANRRGLTRLNRLTRLTRTGDRCGLLR